MLDSHESLRHTKIRINPNLHREWGSVFYDNFRFIHDFMLILISRVNFLFETFPENITVVC